MTKRQFDRLWVAVLVYLLSLALCWATGWIYERWCEWVLGIAIILIIGYPVLMSRLNKD